MALANDLLFTEDERPTMPEFNERFESIGEKLDQAAYLNADKSAVVDGAGNKLLSIPGLRIETGSYVGTGEYGEDKPNSLTFGFEPKLVVIYIEGSNGYLNIVQWGQANMKWYCGVGDRSIALTYSGFTMSWYSSEAQPSAQYQMNSNGQTYRYFAIG